MSTRLPLLADCLINISFHADDLVHTATFDADGGTNTEGLLTLTNDDGASTVVIDTSNTLEKLVAAVQAVRGFECKPTPGLLSSMDTQASALTQRVISDMAATEVTRDGIKCLVFTNAYEACAASSTVALATALAIPTKLEDTAILEMVVDGADAGATGDATLNFLGNNVGLENSLPGVFPATAVEAGWETIVSIAAKTVAINGETEVRKNLPIDLSMIRQFKLNSVGNADNAAVNVHGWLILP